MRKDVPLFSSSICLLTNDFSDVGQSTVRQDDHDTQMASRSETNECEGGMVSRAESGTLFIFCFDKRVKPLKKTRRNFAPNHNDRRSKYTTDSILPVTHKPKRNNGKNVQNDKVTVACQCYIIFASPLIAALRLGCSIVPGERKKRKQ
ncbi:hypothetical protein E2C01_099860 [Portunus trituberculatus]|uniref:Uncharacterized protein n=1 Tax=Portunus trituberculatus TaxID=210409 RepID=A0A5B7KBG5_PORTR|nr:hypothetical protein [Portunus trituberculatus]